MIFSYFKAQPTEYVIRYSSGKPVKEGLGLSFYYMRYNTSIVLIPTSGIDANFVFNEVTNNFQAVTIQGQFTYRIANPKLAAEVMNFAIDLRSRRYLATDPERLPQRVANVIQMVTRAEIQQRSLEQTIRQSEEVALNVLEKVRASEALAALGVEVMALHFTSSTPTPEVARALEADYRETLLRKADEAIYSRRASAVEEERKIKEREMETDISIAAQREKLVQLEGENQLKEAQNRGRALEEEAQYRNRALQMELESYKSLDAPTLLALAMHEIGENAGKINNLTITTEVLGALLDSKQQPKNG